MRSLARLPTRLQLLLLAALVALPMLGILVASSLRLRQEAMARARVQAQRLADTLAAEQESMVAAVQQLFIALAALEQLRAGDPAIRPMLVELRDHSPLFLDVLVADRRGRIWAQAAGGDGHPVDGYRWFQQALATGRLSSGEYAVSRTLGRPTLHFAYPYRDARGQVAGVIAVAVALDAYRSILERTALPPGSSYLLVDHRGIIVARSADADRYVGRAFTPQSFTGMVAGPDSGTSVGLTMVGDERVISWRKLRLPGEPDPFLYVRVGLPVATVLADADRELARNLGLSLAVLLPALALVIWAGKRWIVDRLRLLEAASARMAAGDLAVRVGGQVQGGELGSLASAFDRMAGQLSLREQALAHSERSYRDVLDGTEDAIFVHHAETGQILDVNRGVERLFGHTREELLRGTVESLSQGEPPYAQEEALRRLRQAAAEGSLQFEWRSRRKGGEPFWSEVRLSAATIGGVLRVLATVHDISARKAAEAEAQRLQAQLLQSQKMELVGRLAGGVAHDINNMLAVVLGEAELLRGELPAGHAGHQAIDQIVAAGNRSRDITRQLLTFSRKQLVTPRRVSPAEHLAGTRSTVSRLIGEDVRLALVVAPDAWPVHVDPAQLDQVIMNLVVNARDALPSGGHIRLAAANVTLGPEACRDRAGWRPGEFVRLSVTDDGTGMDAATQAHLFEPFFTTKPAGRGTGLGLATVYGIVTQSGGFLGVESAPGRGSTFEVYLPRATAAAPDSPAAPTATPRGSDTVLLVEDDAAVRQTALRMLQSLGYAVLEAATPEEALAHCGAPGRIDLLLSDVVMPGMRGPELRGRIEALRPGLPTIFMSGHTADGDLAAGVGAGRVLFLQKPFAVAALAERLREALA